MVVNAKKKNAGSNTSCKDRTQTPKNPTPKQDNSTKIHPDAKASVKPKHSPQKLRFARTDKAPEGTFSDDTFEHSSDKKYRKRTIESNWSKYEEQGVDQHADKMRGRDFSVLASYSAGSGSQLRLQEEKYWDESNSTEKGFCINLKDLSHVVKCVPLHERLELEENIFSRAQIEQMNADAKGWMGSYASPTEQVDGLVQTTQEIKAAPSPVVSEKKTIEKSPPLGDSSAVLAQLLGSVSFKEEISKANSREVEKQMNAAGDGLDDFMKACIAVETNVRRDTSAEKKTSVEDWLSSILDD